MVLKRVFCGLIFILMFQSIQAVVTDVLPIARITEPVEFTGLTAPNIFSAVATGKYVN